MEPDTTPFWNRVARQKTFTHELDLDRFAEWVPRESSVLDVGCGYGRMVARLTDLGWGNVAGVDTSSGMIDRGREERPDLDLRSIPLGALPHSPQSHDAVLLMAVLTCIPDGDAQRGLVAECLRVLRPGGTLWITDLWLHDDERNVLRYRDDRPEGAPHGVFQVDEGHTFRHHTRDWIEDLLSGAETVAEEDTPFVTMNGNTAQGFRRALVKR